jgi:hypothetical protein
MHDFALSPTSMADDVLRLVRRQPYLGLNSAQSAARRLRRELSLLGEWGHVLPHWRTIRCERLDFVYDYLLILGCYDSDLRNDLLFRRGSLSWHVSVIGAWIAALAASPTDAPALQRLLDLQPRYPWIYQFALAATQSRSSAAMAEPLALMAQLRALLAPVDKPKIKLRAAQDFPSGEFEEARRRVKGVYRSSGREAAAAFIENYRFRDGETLTSLLRGRRLEEEGAPAREPWHWTFG